MERNPYHRGQSSSRLRPLTNIGHHLGFSDFGKYNVPPYRSFPQDQCDGVFFSTIDLKL